MASALADVTTAPEAIGWWSGKLIKRILDDVQSASGPQDVSGPPLSTADARVRDALATIGLQVSRPFLAALMNDVRHEVQEWVASEL